MSASTERDHDGLKEKTLFKSNNAGDCEVTVKATYQVKSNKVVGRLEKKQRIYFVKYRGLSPLHNCWVSEILLVKEAPKQLANFKKKLQQGKVVLSLDTKHSCHYLFIVMKYGNSFETLFRVYI